MGMPTFLDLLMPNMQAPMFTIALDKWDTGTWDFGHIDESKYVGSLQTVAVDDSCSSGGSWKVGNMFAQFANQTIPQMCGFFGMSALAAPAAMTLLHNEMRTNGSDSDHQIQDMTSST